MRRTNGREYGDTAQNDGESPFSVLLPAFFLPRWASPGRQKRHRCAPFVGPAAAVDAPAGRPPDDETAEAIETSNLVHGGHMNRLTYVLRQRAPPRVAIAVQQVHEHYSATCTTEVLMRKLLTLGLASLFLVVTGCQDTTTTGPLAGPEFHAVGAGHVGHLSSFAMLDDFAVETGASGSGKTKVRHSSVRVNVNAKGLLPNTDYELNITIDFASFVTFTATSNKNGKIKFREDLEGLAPGTHRLDFFVTHDHSTGTGVAFGLFDRDLLLRCFPAVNLTIS